MINGGSDVGEALVCAHGVRLITFTGSSAVGRRVGELAGRHLKKVSLELGGKSPLIVLDDADIDAAASAGAWASFLHQGQICMQIARRTCATGEPCPDDEVRRLTLVILQSIHLAHEAVDIIFRTAGSSASRKDSMLGRYWRNVGIMRGHLAHQSDSAAVNYGRAHFGQPTVGIA